MSHTTDDPRCPECGEPIGQTATYCMHCSADLTEERAAADTDDDGMWDGAETPGSSESPEPAYGTDSTTADSGQLLDPDSLADNTLTVIVGILGGIVVGVFGTVVLLLLTGSPWALGFGLAAWLGSTAYLARRRTVQGAISKGAYAVAVVLLVVPVIALSPLAEVEGGLAERGGLFVVLLTVVAVPASIAAGIGWFTSRFVPENAAGSEG